MRCLVSATGLAIALASPAFAADRLSGACIDTPPSPQRKGVQRNIMTGTLADNNVMRFNWVREGAETEPGGEIVMTGPIRD